MVVCLFSACNDDDDDKIPQGPAITYAGKLPSRIGDYTFVYDDNNRCTQVKKNSYVYGEIDYDKGVVIMDDEEAKVSFNSDGYVTGISASWNYNEDGYSYKDSGKISFSYNGNGQLVSYIESSSREWEGGWGKLFFSRKLQGDLHLERWKPDQGGYQGRKYRRWRKI